MWNQKWWCEQFLKLVHEQFNSSSAMIKSRTTDTQWKHKSKKSENLGRCGRQNMLRPYLKIWEWEWIFGCTVKAVSSLGVSSLWTDTFRTIWLASITQGSNSSNDDPISIELENLWWIKTLNGLLRLSFNNREHFWSLLAGLFLRVLKL